MAASRPPASSPSIAACLLPRTESGAHSTIWSAQRRAAYACDVTYVTNNELGFDYLRDHLAYETEELTLTTRPLNFAIVDEAFIGITPKHAIKIKSFFITNIFQ